MVANYSGHCAQHLPAVPVAYTPGNADPAFIVENVNPIDDHAHLAVDPPKTIALVRHFPDCRRFRETCTDGSLRPSHLKTILSITTPPTRPAAVR